MIPGHCSLCSSARNGYPSIGEDCLRCCRNALLHGLDATQRKPIRTENVLSLARLCVKFEALLVAWKHTNELAGLQSKPPHETYTVLLEACAREQKAAVASELLQWANEDGVQPTIGDLLSLLASQPACKRGPLATRLIKVGQNLNQHAS